MIVLSEVRRFWVEVTSGLTRLPPILTRVGGLFAYRAQKGIWLIRLVTVVVECLFVGNCVAALFVFAKLVC